MYEVILKEPYLGLRWNKCFQPEAFVFQARPFCFNIFSAIPYSRGNINYSVSGLGAISYGCSVFQRGQKK